MDARARRFEGCRTFIGSGEAEHLMACRDQVLHDGGADESGCTGNKNTHENSLSWVMRASLFACGLSC